jgi:exodeoxyribonuclease-5
VNEKGRIDVLVDWKSDTVVREIQVSIYRRQVRSYLKATGARKGLIVFLNSDHVETVVCK